jgi:transposase
MAKPTLLPDPTCLHLHPLDASDTAITALVTTNSLEAACSVCRKLSARIHSRYVGEVADLPWMGCAVYLELHVRRFFCSNPACARQIFTEHLPTARSSSSIDVRNRPFYAQKAYGASTDIHSYTVSSAGCAVTCAVRKNLLKRGYNGSDCLF